MQLHRFEFNYIKMSSMGFEYQAVKPKDFTKIDSRNFGELLWWSYHFDITLEQLVCLLDEVGETVEAVRKRIQKAGGRELQK